MSKSHQKIGTRFLLSALVMLCIGLVLGLTASAYYLFPDFGKHHLPFTALRPMHVSSVMFWILMGATGCVYSGLETLALFKPTSKALARVQWFLWVIAIVCIMFAYMAGNFGGREYWEFNPIFALPIAIAWLLFLYNFIKAASSIKQWPVYVWMWMTGIAFFLFSFTENYLWLFPYFQDHFVTDMTIQWKVNGALSGAWNQMLYGTAFYLMERINKDSKVGHSKLAFGMYFLGLFNLMFNWGHHIYTLPTDSYVRYTGYLVSMTEWVFFVRIIYQWRQSVTEAQKNYHYFPYRFLMAADIWVLINLGQAILMSIPAFNLYTHGTHVTVAHAMGTTIGINSMILFAACFEFLANDGVLFRVHRRWLNNSFWVAQAALFSFWLSLNIAGVKKGLWQMSEVRIPFSKMMEGLRLWFGVFACSGVVLATTLGTIAFLLLRFYWVTNVRRAKNRRFFQARFEKLS